MDGQESLYGQALSFTIVDLLSNGEQVSTLEIIEKLCIRHKLFAAEDRKCVYLRVYRSLRKLKSMGRIEMTVIDNRKRSKKYLIALCSKNS
jgi:hypothetical protein